MISKEIISFTSMRFVLDYDFKVVERKMKGTSNEKKSKNKNF